MPDDSSVTDCQASVLQQTYRHDLAGLRLDTVKFNSVASKRGISVSRPAEYEQACVAKRNVPYQRSVVNFQGQPMTEGVLVKGRVVWVQKAKPAKGRPVPAYVEGLGIVSVDPRYLAQAGTGPDAAPG